MTYKQTSKKGLLQYFTSRHFLQNKQRMEKFAKLKLILRNLAFYTKSFCLREDYKWLQELKHSKLE